ncbi:MAG: PRD domain-containing protein [Erysipelothrix sp.]|nr:PRD domain-containing protein [Erysipelothrix sp.]
MEKTKAEVKVLKILNNSAMLVSDGKSELVLLGRGIAFNRKNEERIKSGLEVDKIYALERSANRFKMLIENNSSQVNELVINSMQLLMERNGTDIRPEAMIGFCDHVSIMFSRVLKGESIMNPFLSETKVLYPESFEKAQSIAHQLNAQFDVIIPEEEVGYIALHLQNIVSPASGEQMKVMNKIAAITSDYITDELKINLDKESLIYARFMTHLKFVVMRLLRNQRSDNIMTDMILSQLSQYRPQAEKIVDIIEQETKHRLSLDELAYLMIHVGRILEN